MILPQVDRHAEDSETPGRVSEFSIARSTKSACSAAVIRVVSEFQNRMSNAGTLAEQVVVDPVVPDQVAGPEPREDLGQRPAVEYSLARRLRLARFANRSSTRTPPRHRGCR